MHMSNDRPQQSILDLFKLEGQVAMIVGGNRGLGLSMAKALAEAGATISISARDEEENSRAENIIRHTYQVDCISSYCDVTVEKSVQDAVTNTMERFGRIDILVNSAGINIRGSIESLS